MDISIFIRAKNEAELLGRCLEQIFAQHHSFKIEVILLDSGSNDATIDIARRFPVRILQFSPALFSFSAALNVGATIATGTIFVPLSAHAVPTDPHWLQRLVEPLFNDPTITATYSRQIPWPDVSIPEAQQIRRTFPQKQITITPDRSSLALAEGRQPTEITSLSNVCAAYRREFVVSNPFRALPFSEDRCMGLQILEAGGSVTYVPESVVYHSHAPDFHSFRKIARTATLARFMINRGHTVAVAKKQCSRNKPSLFQAILASTKIPLYVIWLGVSLCVVLLAPCRPARQREMKWRIASLGTTVGKAEGILLARNHSYDQPLPVAKTEAILDALSEIGKE